MKAIWKGSIGFGLVNIPVKLYSATQQSNLDFDMVEAKNMGKIHFKRVNEETGKEVKWEDIGKAYKLNDKYILLDDEDFENAAPEKSKVIEINHFVKESEIDTIYYENSYFVEPEKSGTRAYALLRAALTESGKVGISQFVFRTAEVLSVLKPLDNILVLSKIRFAEEIRDPGEFNLPAEKGVKPAELKMALSLINQYSGKFNIKKFKDEYSSKLLKLIKAKSKGKNSTQVIREITKSDTRDLMEQLKASLKKAS
ncbi:MAG TPA: Ku protein [Ignavibacteria bacterium]|nr:Ku protein [Ignavibacteria bacterium]